MASNGRRIKLCEFGKRGLFSLPGVFAPTDVISRMIELIFSHWSKGTFFLAGRFLYPRRRFVPTDVLSRQSFCRRTFCPSKHFVPLDVLSRRTFFPQGVLSFWTFFPTDVLSLDVRSPDVLSLDVLSGHRKDSMDMQLDMKHGDMDMDHWYTS